MCIRDGSQETCEEPKSKLTPTIVFNKGIVFSRSDNDALNDIAWYLRRLPEDMNVNQHIKAHGYIYLISDLVDALFDNVSCIQDPDLKMFINNLIELYNNPENDGVRYTIADVINEIGYNSWVPTDDLCVELDEGVPSLISKGGTRRIFEALDLRDGYRAISVILDYATGSVSPKKERATNQ